MRALTRLLLAFNIILAVVPPITVLARAPLTFEERVKAQEAIERVYYAHRIWPTENPQPKPPFEEMVPREVIEAKVTDYLKKCVALEKNWRRPIEAAHLQAEMARMARDTKDPAMLEELFTALDHDSAFIAECLARPILADVRVHESFATDAVIHRDARTLAEDILARYSPDTLFMSTSGRYGRIRYVLGNDADTGLLEPKVEGGMVTVPIDSEILAKVQARHGDDGYLHLQEIPEALILSGVCAKGPAELDVQSLCIPKMNFGSWWEEVNPAYAATSLPSMDYSFALPAVNSLLLASCTDTWSPTSATGAPSARWAYSHLGQLSCWTGAEMLIWGGWQAEHYGYFNTGGLYSPSTDSWQSTSTGTSCPSARSYNTSVWTGTHAIIWGGINGTTNPVRLGDGALFSPTSNTWTPIAASNAPKPTIAADCIWTGTEMYLWVAPSPSGPSNQGAKYNPGTNSWSYMATGTTCPTPREDAAHIWTGNKYIIWGGANLNTGGIYDPSSDSWTPTSTGANCPTGRTPMSMAWDGEEMIVWGGVDATHFYLGTGGRYNPTTDTWRTMSTGTNCPSARHGEVTVWTGKEMVVWSGYPTTNTGGRYNPFSDTWIPTSTASPVPTARWWATGVWTGTQMIVWGGVGPLNTGGVYTILPTSVTCTAQSTPSSGHPPLSVLFAASATLDGCTGTATYLWDFGDGSTSTLQNPSHTYTSTGIFVWKATATVNGITGSQAGTITVTGTQPEVILRNATGPAGGTVKVLIDLVANGHALCGITDVVTFDTTLLQFVSAKAGPAAIAAGKDVSSSVQGNKVNLAVFGFNTNVIGDGTVAELTFSIVQGATGSTTLAGDCLSGDCQAHDIISTCTPGTITFIRLPGDCNGSGTVTIGEIQGAINMFLGLTPPACGVDCNGDGVVSIGEVQRVINVFLGLTSSC